MENTNWDIFTSGNAPESLWFGYQLAKGLTDRAQSVRVFTERLSELGTVLADIDSTLWLQTHRGIEIADSRVARVCAPPQNVIQLFDSAFPAEYLERFSAQCETSCRVQVVAHDSEREPTSPITLLERTDRSSSYLAQIGDLPRGAGYIKQGRNGPMMRRKWAQVDVRGFMLKSLGLPGDLLDGRMFVYFDVRGGPPILPWVRTLAARSEETCMFLHHGELQTEVFKSIEKNAAATVFTRIGNLTVVRLPPIRWFLVDELIWACDVLMTDQPDKASRACECGTPVIWGADHEADMSFFDRYAMDGRQEARQAVMHAFQALQSGKHVQQAWETYRMFWDHVDGLAGRIAQRIQRAPDMADVLLAGIAAVQSEAVSRQFSPTLPPEFI